MPKPNVPTTDIEAYKVFEEQYRAEIGDDLAAMYACYRSLGKNVLDAYLATLDNHAEIAKKVHSEKA